MIFMENITSLKFGHSVRITRKGSLEGLAGQIVKLTSKRAFVRVAGRTSNLYVRLDEVERLQPKRPRKAA